MEQKQSTSILPCRHVQRTCFNSTNQDNTKVSCRIPKTISLSKKKITFTCINSNFTYNKTNIASTANDSRESKYKVGATKISICKPKQGCSLMFIIFTAQLKKSNSVCKKSQTCLFVIKSSKKSLFKTQLGQHTLKSHKRTWRKVVTKNIIQDVTIIN